MDLPTLKKTENPWGFEEENLMWGYNTHPRSLEDNQGLKVNYLSHQEDNKTGYLKHPWKFEERGNAMWQHTSSKFMIDSKVSGHTSSKFIIDSKASGLSSPAGTRTSKTSKTSKTLERGGICHHHLFTPAIVLLFIIIIMYCDLCTQVIYTE